MRWALIEFTHYSGDDALFDNYAAADYSVLHADSLTEAVAQVTRPGAPLTRIDDSDSPYGGVYTSRRLARRYFQLNDFVRSSTLCYGIFAESVLQLNFDQMMAC